MADTVLEPGDRLFIPKLPNYVTISGDVLNPGSVQFTPGKRISDYINRLGGFQASADDGRTFIVLPNGEARRQVSSIWNIEPIEVTPGSTIVVPPDPSPFDLLDFARGITPVLSNLAVTAAAISVIGRD